MKNPYIFGIIVKKSFGNQYLSQDLTYSRILRMLQCLGDHMCKCLITWYIPAVLQSMGSQRVGHNWATEQQQLYTKLLSTYTYDLLNTATF